MNIKYRTIEAIVMADDNNVECVEFGEVYTVDNARTAEDKRCIGAYVAYDKKGEGVFGAESLDELKEEAHEQCIDDHLVVSGYGRKSGRKFWQLPIKLQNEIKKMIISKGEGND